MDKIIAWVIYGKTFCASDAPKDVTETPNKIPVLDTDNWTAYVGLCSVCGKRISDDVRS